MQVIFSSGKVKENKNMILHFVSFDESLAFELNTLVKISTVGKCSALKAIS